MSAKAKKATGTAGIESQLQQIERESGSGDVDFGRGGTLHVSSLGKPYFENGITKGALMRYYVKVWGALMPHVRDRPLVLKRYPDGASGPMFFQQNAGEHVPDSVRVEEVETRDEGAKPRIIGGDLATLLYTVQIGSIEVHPWLSRVGRVNTPDRCLIDLDPGDDVPFSQVVGLTRQLLAIIREAGLRAAVKTSGASGMHLVVPLPPGVSYDASSELAMLIARVCVARNPDHATVERSIGSRPAGTIYVDPMQNARGKSMACAYSVRAKEGATVSAPLGERELTARLRLSSFTMQTVPGRVTRLGDLWGTALTAAPSRRTLVQAAQVLGQMLNDAPSPTATRPQRARKRSPVRRK
jgi:bifunctional non-homologous end joining protein LigD